MAAGVNTSINRILFFSTITFFEILKFVNLLIHRKKLPLLIKTIDQKFNFTIDKIL